MQSVTKESSGLEMTQTRVIFFGTAELACPILAALAHDSSVALAAVVTQPDRPKGRDLKVQPTPVKMEAARHELPVLQPARARNPEFIQTLADLQPGLIVVAAYGQILPESILHLPPHGCLNVHTSLLPKYRGAAPIQWAILNDEPETGVTIMKMDAGLDTGDIVSQKATPIHPSDNAQTLHDRLATMGGALLLATLPDYLAGKIISRKQSEQVATYARKITKEDGELDWTLSARAVWNRIRAFTPWPGAFTLLPGEAKLPLLKIWEAQIVESASGTPGAVLECGKAGITVACGQSALRIHTLQREGGRRMTAGEFLSGYDLKAGTSLA
jgi:methionyl-tRNA formyltransferase